MYKDKYFNLPVDYEDSNMIKLIIETNKNIGIHSSNENIEISLKREDHLYYRLNGINHGRAGLRFDRNLKSTGLFCSAENRHGSGNVFNNINSSYNIYINKDHKKINEFWVVNASNNISARQIVYGTTNGEVDRASLLVTYGRDKIDEKYQFLHKDFDIDLRKLKDEYNIINYLKLSYYATQYTDLYMDFFGSSTLEETIKNEKEIEKYFVLFSGYEA